MTHLHRSDIKKSKHTLIFIYLVAGDLSSNDFGKNRGHNRDYVLIVPTKQNAQYLLHQGIDQIDILLVFVETSFYISQVILVTIIDIERFE